jgi:ATP-dependent Lon protease
MDRNLGKILFRVKNILNENLASELEDDGEEIQSKGYFAKELDAIKSKVVGMVEKAGVSKSLVRVNILGLAKIVAYFDNGADARKFEEYIDKRTRGTIKAYYKMMSVGKSKGAVILDFKNL